MLKESLLYIGFAQSVFAAIVIGTKRSVSVSDKILIMCLLTIAFRFMVKVLYQEQLWFLNPDFSVSVIPLTFGPYLFLYTTYLVEGRTTFKLKHYLHFVPLLVVVAFYSIFFKEVLSFNVVRYFETDKFLPIRIIFGLLLYSSILIYTVLTFVKLRDFRRRLGTEYSYNTGRLRLNWLNFIALLFSIIFTTYLIVGGINALSFAQVIDLEVLSHIGLTILAYAVSYFGLKQTMLFKVKYPKPRTSEPGPAENGAKSRFSKEKAESLILELGTHMEAEMPYLNPELTLSELSSDLNISKYDLTYLLNYHIGKNFFSYVNEYRLNKVVEKLKDSQFDHLTIISIAFDSGFNSKSTFNSLFKQHTGKTPSEFKKSFEMSPGTN